MILGKIMLKPKSGSELTVFAQHHAAALADAPAVSSKRRTATQEIAPVHSTGTVAELGCSRTARRKLGEINGVRGSHRNTQKNARSYEKLHSLSSLTLSAGKRSSYRPRTVKASFLVRRKINRKYLKVRTNKSNTRLTGQHRCPFYAAIGRVFATRVGRKRSPDATQHEAPQIQGLHQQILVDFKLMTIPGQQRTTKSALIHATVLRCAQQTVRVRARSTKPPPSGCRSARDFLSASRCAVAA
jgi:hypothetical protein